MAWNGSNPFRRARQVSHSWHWSMQLGVDLHSGRPVGCRRVRHFSGVVSLS